MSDDFDPERSVSGHSPERRLAGLGLTLPVVTPPLAAYVPAVESGKLVYTAGQLPVADGQLLATGKVGAQVGSSEAAALAQDLRAERAGRRCRGGLAAWTRSSGS